MGLKGGAAALGLRRPLEPSGDLGSIFEPLVGTRQSASPLWQEAEVGSARHRLEGLSGRDFQCCALETG